jgi:2-dehydropantoate 2-reductase
MHSKKEEMMERQKIAVVGIGAIGSVLAAALLSKYPDTILVGHRPETGKALRQKGIQVSGVMNYQVSVRNYVHAIRDLKSEGPLIMFICSKTFHLENILKELQDVVVPGTKIISTHNGLGTEDLIAEQFGEDTAFRMSMNYGAAIKSPGDVAATFFNRPNHIGCLTRDNRELASRIAALLTDCGLDTQSVDDIKRFVWQKMIMKCTMASICAVTNRTIRECLGVPSLREIADACFQEALSVAKAEGYDLGQDYLNQALGYLDKVGQHKDSMCFDIENHTRTEIDFLGGKVVAYGRKHGLKTPYYKTMTNLVSAMEDAYLNPS